MALLFDELPVAFPFYTDKEKQVRFNVNTDEPCGASLISPKDSLLSFQIRKTSTSQMPSSVQILKAEDDSLVADISVHMASALIPNALNGYDYLTFQGFPPITTNPVGGAPAATLDLPPGEYYVKMSFPNGEILWSECFLVPLERFRIFGLEDCKFIRLEWMDTKDIAPIHYNSDLNLRFQNSVFLDSNIYNSEPEIEQEGIRNGDNKLLPTFQKVSIKYRVELLVPDFLKLALSILPIHSDIQFTTEFAKRKGTIENVSVTSKPEANGYFSEVTIKFEQDLAVIKRGCGDAIPASPCPSVPGGWDFGFSIAAGATDLLITANIPPGFTANIRSYYDGGAETVRRNVPPGDLSGGYSIPFYELPSDTIDLEIVTFNCTSIILAPHTPPVPLPYSPIAMNLFYEIEHDPAVIGTLFTLSPTEKSALNVLVHDLWFYELYRKTWAIWPFLGPIRASQKYNLRKPGNTNQAHRLTFPNGSSHTAKGTILDPFSGVQIIDTNFDILAEKGNTMSASMILDIQANFAVSNRGFCGVTQGLSKQFVMQAVTGIAGAGRQLLCAAYGSGSGDYMTEPLTVNQKGTYILTRRAVNDAAFSYNGFPDMSNNVYQTGTMPAGNVYAGGMNGNLGWGTLDGIIDFFALADGFSDADNANMAQAIATYKTSLGR